MTRIPAGGRPRAVARPTRLLVATVLVGAVLVACGKAGSGSGSGCVPVALTAEPVTVTSRGGAHAPVALVARVTADGVPKENVRVTFHLLAPESTSGEYLGDDRTDADGVAEVGRGYVASVDRERYRKAVKVVAEHDGLLDADGVDYCEARAEAPFKLVEA